MSGNDGSHVCPAGPVHDTSSAGRCGRWRQARDARLLVAPSSEDQGTFAVQVEVNVHDAAPNVTFAVARAVDLNPDGICTTASGWAT